MTQQAQENTDEIEVTPEMKSAGGRILADYFDTSQNTGEAFAVEVFRAMISAYPVRDGIV